MMLDGSDDLITPEDVLDYIYGVLHSPSYREKYREFLKTDFPRVPAPADRTEFLRYAEFGSRLRELHLMTAPDISDFDTTYPVAGDNTVDKLTLDGTDVYINTTQYFGNVPDIAWNFYIGGYQPAQKWLKDRKGRQMTHDDIVHYQRIIKVLLETDKVMKEIG
jgi:predicted helicase